MVPIIENAKWCRYFSITQMVKCHCAKVLIKKGGIIALAFFTMILQLLLRGILFELVVNVFAQLASLVPISDHSNAAMD